MRDELLRCIEKKLCSNCAHPSNEHYDEGGPCLNDKYGECKCNEHHPFKFAEPKTGNIIEFPTNNF